MKRFYKVFISAILFLQISIAGFGQCPEINVISTSVLGVSCTGGNDGQITINFTPNTTNGVFMRLYRMGTTTPASEIFSGGVGSITFTGLKSNSYDFRVIHHAAGCTSFSNVLGAVDITVLEPEAPYPVLLTSDICNRDIQMGFANKINPSRNQIVETRWIIDGPYQPILDPDYFTDIVFFNPTVSGLYTMYWTASVAGCGPALTSTGVSFQVNELPTINSSLLTTICSGNFINYTITSSTVGTAFTWTRVSNSNINSGVTNSGSSETISETLLNSSTIPQLVFYQLQPTGPTPTNCTGIPSVLTVTVNPTPTATSTPANAAICTNQALNFSLSGNLANTSFSWTTSVTSGSIGGISSGAGAVISQTPTTSESQATFFYCVSLANSDYNCASEPLIIPVTVSGLSTLSGITNQPISLNCNSVYDLSPVRSSSGAEVTLVSSNESIAKVVNKKLQWLNSGVVTVSAFQLGTANACPSNRVDKRISIANANPLVTFNGISANVCSVLSPFPLNLITNSSGAVSFGIGSGNNLELAGSNSVNILGAGTSVIRATIAGADCHLQRIVTATFNFSTNSQRIVNTLSGNLLLKCTDETFPNLSRYIYSTSNLPLSYTMSNSTTVSIINNRIQALGKEGTVEITASQSGNRCFSAAAPVKFNVKVEKRPNQISFPGLFYHNCYGPNASSTITGFAAYGAYILNPNNMQLIYSISTSTGNVILLDSENGVFRFLNPGTTLINVSSNNTCYKDFSQQSQIVVDRHSAQINNISSDPLYANCNTPSLNLNSITTSLKYFYIRNSAYPRDLPTIKTVLDENVAVINNGILSFLGVGSTQLVVSVTGTNCYYEAILTKNISYSKATPIIKGLSANDYVGNCFSAPIDLSKVSVTPSTIAFTKSISNTNVANIINDKLTFLSAGSSELNIDVQASQCNNAVNVKRKITVSKVTPTITKVANATVECGKQVTIAPSITYQTPYDLSFLSGASNLAYVTDTKYNTLQSGVTSYSVSTEANECKNSSTKSANITISKIKTITNAYRIRTVFDSVPNTVVVFYNIKSNSNAELAITSSNKLFIESYNKTTGVLKYYYKRYRPGKNDYPTTDQYLYVKANQTGCYNSIDKTYKVLSVYGLARMASNARVENVDEVVYNDTTITEQTPELDSIPSVENDSIDLTKLTYLIKTENYAIADVNSITSAIIYYKIKDSRQSLELPQTDQNNFAIYPNPTTEHFKIYYETPDGFNVEIFDSVGKRVLQGSTQTNELSVSLSTKGTYVIKLRDKTGNTKIQKLVVQ